MTLEILNRCDLAMKSDSKFHVISVTENKAFFEKMCENAKICFEKIIVRIFIFVIKNKNHDLILEILYEKNHVFVEIFRVVANEVDFISFHFISIS